MPADIIGWAERGSLELLTSVPPCETEDGIHLGIVAISPACAMPMFRRDGSGPTRIKIYGMREAGSGKPFKALTQPATGLEVQAADIMITHEQVVQFEEDHGMVRRADPRGGKSARWDWEAFWLAVLRRVHNHGLPETQRALTQEMLDWFARRSPDGETPDERTVSRKVGEMWKQLRDESDLAEP